MIRRVEVTGNFNLAVQICHCPEGNWFVHKKLVAFFVFPELLENSKGVCNYYNSLHSF